LRAEELTSPIGTENQNSLADASRAPSLSVRSFAHTTSGATRPHPAEHGGSVSDHSNDPFDSIRDHLRVFDDVGQRVDDASHQHLPGLQRKLLKAAEFMRVTRAGEGQIQSPDVRLLNDWQDILKRYVAVMGTFRVAPTHVQAHTV